jgi:hypothetical protein
MMLYISDASGRFPGLPEALEPSEVSRHHREYRAEPLPRKDLGEPPCLEVPLPGGGSGPGAFSRGCGGGTPERSGSKATRALPQDWRKRRSRQAGRGTPGTSRQEANRCREGIPGFLTLCPIPNGISAKITRRMRGTSGLLQGCRGTISVPSTLLTEQRHG